MMNLPDENQLCLKTNNKEKNNKNPKHKNES